MTPLFFPSAGKVLLWGALIGYTALVVILIVNVLSENRKPLNALAWIMAWCSSRWEGRCSTSSWGAASGASA